MPLTPDQINAEAQKRGISLEQFQIPQETLQQHMPPQQHGLSQYVHNLSSHLPTQEQRAEFGQEVSHIPGAFLKEFSKIPYASEAMLPPTMQPILKNIPEYQGPGGMIGRGIEKGAEYYLLSQLGGGALSAASKIPGLAGKGAKYLSQEGALPGFIREGAIGEAYNASQGGIPGLGILAGGIPGAIAGKVSLLGKPTRLMREIREDIPGQAAGYRSEAEKFYGSSIDKYPNEAFYGSNAKIKNFKGMDQILDRAHVEDAYANFSAHPTLKNAQTLRKDVMSEVASIKRQPQKYDPDNRAIMQGNKLGDLLKNQITRRLNSFEPQAAKDYLEANRIWSSEAIPFEKLSSQVKGTRLYPQQTLTTIEKTERKFAKENQPLSERTNAQIQDYINELKHVIEKQKAWRGKLEHVAATVGPLTGLGIGYQSEMPHPYGEALGVTLGSLAPRLFSHTGRPNKFGDIIRQLALGNALGGQ